VDVLKPFVKWAGGKRQLLPELEKHLPADTRRRVYYEPFVGGGALLFALRPSRALINDSNAQLVMTYNVIKNSAAGLLERLEDCQRKHSRDFYYAMRNLDRDAAAFDRLSGIEKAARLIYLNKTCYNGLFRVNSRGEFNVPPGKYHNPLICDAPAIRRISAYLNTNHISISCGDFAAALERAGDNAFVYFDPPYHSPDKRNFTGYQAGGFDEEAQKRLAGVFKRISRRGARCLLSNADTALIRELYRDFEIIPLQARRLINAQSSGRGAANEVLIKNW
jgi:DNA adenine methylase